jgi:hypothetical protein
VIRCLRAGQEECGVRQQPKTRRHTLEPLTHFRQLRPALSLMPGIARAGPGKLAPTA